MVSVRQRSADVFGRYVIVDADRQGVTDVAVVTYNYTVDNGDIEITIVLYYIKRMDICL